MYAPVRFWTGKSRAMNAVFQLCCQFAAAPYPILLVGEPGSGKTYLAAEIHRQAKRSGPLVCESAAYLPEQLLISELCGHTRGSFTGAVSKRAGMIVSARGGTFFLDELSHATTALQGVLLKLLESNSLRPLGGDREAMVDVRLVAATNEDPEEAVASGRLRRDLLDRFGYFIIRVPPLRERPEDIMPLTRRFLDHAAAELMDEHPEPVISRDLEIALQTATWPGNVRQLRMVCQYMVTLWDRVHPLTIGNLPPEFVESLSIGQKRGRGKTSPEQIEAALAAVGRNRTHAARLLGISVRQLQRIIRDKGVA